MKNQLSLFIILICSLLLTSCIGFRNDDVEPMDDNFDPVIVTRAEMENSVELRPPVSLIKSGKIYVKDNLMFINEINQGFHVYNYSNPQNPVKIGFIQALGATDLAIRDNIIYLNQAVDLVTLIYNSNNNSISVSSRNRNIFPSKPSPEGVTEYTDGDNIVIDWVPAN